MIKCKIKSRELIKQSQKIINLKTYNSQNQQRFQYYKTKHIDTMINVSEITKYLQKLQDDKDNQIVNIFLANSENEILLSLTKNRTNECSTLGTLLNDSLYILKLNLAEEEDSKQSEPLEIILQTEQDEAIFLYNIENYFIYGVSVKKDNINRCRDVVRKSYKELKEELSKTIRWMEIDRDNY